ncbi:nitroreductase family protein [Kocuria rosea]|uniref:nitroreductase family protein n=1 Tax=Kocuria rosea TaxID=1275 RepID=UPI0025407F5C|nr:nitroreductase family protein [Kocuria rosea]WIG16367.1 nitroreductase family protein [Kocuria rosea]
MSVNRLKRLAGKSRNAWYRRPRLTIVSSAYVRETRATAAGISKYKQNHSSGQNRYLLRRNVHMLEKGLTMEPRRETFAVGYVEETVDALKLVIETDPRAVDDLEVRWMINVLSDYFVATAESKDATIRRAHQTFALLGSDVLGQFSGYGPHVPEFSTAPLTIEQLENLAHSRRSIRWFDGRHVSSATVDRAMCVAAESPTACNRQPYRFAIFNDSASAARIAALAMGTAGYVHQLVGLAVVVGQLGAFFDERDRHLIYIDGSLAAMSFIYGLEAQGVASCIINWPDIPERELKMARALNLEKHERVVMLIAYGYPKPGSLAPRSIKSALESIREFRKA